MRPSCPKCFTVVTYEEHGGLFSIRCPNCDWKEEGTCNHALLPPVERGPVLVAKAVAPVSAAALKAIREECKSKKVASLEVLRTKLTSGAGLWLGEIPKFKVAELRARLSSVGILLEELHHEEG